MGVHVDFFIYHLLFSVKVFYFGLSLSMGPSVSLLPLRRWAGHGFLTFVAMALLGLFAIQVLANTFRRHGLNSAQFAAGSDQRPPLTTDEQDGCCCGGFWNICCRTSPEANGAVYTHKSGQLPIISISNNYFVSHIDENSPSTVRKYTMKLVRPLLTLATGAWCSRVAHQQPSSLLSSSPTSSSSSSQATGITCAANADWPGFSSLQYIFSFGDSFTTTWFNWRDNPPSPSIPLGNPPYPGYTSASGANWIDYLTVKYNQTFLQTYNLAIGGAAVDQDIQLTPPMFGRGPFEPDRRSLKDQVQRDFITGYAYKNAPEAPDWNGGNALFTIWIGINDVVGSYGRGPDGPEGTKALNDRIFRTYMQLTEILYDHGARNFMFLNVPAVDRSPVIMERGPRDVAWLGADLTDFNDRVAKMAGDLKSRHQDVNAWVYDTRTDFSKVLDDPTAFPQTSGLKNVTDTCDKYGLIW